MDMDLNNRLTEDETLEQAYDIFLELAADNLDPADVLLFNLQFEERCFRPHSVMPRKRSQTVPYHLAGINNRFRREKGLTTVSPYCV